MNDEAKALVERLRDYGDRYDFEIHYDRIEAADHIEALETQLESANEALRERLDICETQAREIERLRGALGWYEKQANDCRKITREGDDARYALDRDGGERARAALKEIEGDWR